MPKTIRVLLTVFPVAALLLPAAATAEGNITRVTYWTVERGSESQFEAGLAAHNKLHADQGDDWAFHTFQVLTGPHTGKYIRITFGHEWADFDTEGDNLEGDAEDAALHTAPYIEGAKTSFYKALPEISRTGPPTGMSRSIFFHLKYGHSRPFVEAITKVHQALEGRDWRPYAWYTLVDGGSSPTYVVTLPSDGWAGFAPGDTDLAEVVSEKYGEAAAEIWEALESSVAKSWSHTIARRADLSYVPSE